MSEKEKGNVLFLILIAVALFAALSYAVTNSTRSSSGSDREVKTLESSQILQYGLAIRNAIDRMRIVSNCNVENISFERPPFDGSDTDYFNALARPGFECHVFHPDGGAVPYETPKQKWLETSFDTSEVFEEYYFPAHVCVPDIPVRDNGNCRINGLPNNELLFMVPFLTEDMCSSLNKLVDIPDYEITPIPENSTSGTPVSTVNYYTGAFSENNHTMGYRFSGLAEACASYIVNGSPFIFYMTLWER